MLTSYKWNTCALHLSWTWWTAIFSNLVSVPSFAIIESCWTIAVFVCSFPLPVYSRVLVMAHFFDLSIGAVSLTFDLRSTLLLTVYELPVFCSKYQASFSTRPPGTVFWGTCDRVFSHLIRTWHIGVKSSFKWCNVISGSAIDALCRLARGLCTKVMRTYMLPTMLCVPMQILCNRHAVTSCLGRVVGAREVLLMKYQALYVAC